MKVYIDSNTIQIATLLPLESLKWDNFRDCCVYKIGLIVIREVSRLSPPFGEGQWTWGHGSSKGFRLFAFPANIECRELWNSTVNRYRWILREGSLKLS